MIDYYYAPKPKYTNWQWFKFIGARLIFPPILLLDALSYCLNKLFGKMIGQQILPSLKFYTATQVTKGDPKFKGLESQTYFVNTYDGASLETLEIKKSDLKNINCNHVIYFLGNGAILKNNIDQMVEDALALNANIIGFNYRGVQLSRKSPTSSYDLVVDGIAQVQRLLDKGVSPSCITLKGQSIGGGISSLVAAHFHEHNIPIKMFNSRSFSSITNVLIGHLRLKKDGPMNVADGQQDSTKGILLGYLAWPIIKSALYLTKWEFNAGTAFQKIPKAYRDYIVMRTNKKNRAHHMDDQVIPHYASIHTHLKSERRKDKAIFEACHQPLDSQEKINERKDISRRHKMIAQTVTINAHNYPISEIQNSNGVTGSNYFYNFVNKKVPKIYDTSHLSQSEINDNLNLS